MHRIDRQIVSQEALGRGEIPLLLHRHRQVVSIVRVFWRIGDGTSKLVAGLSVVTTLVMFHARPVHRPAIRGITTNSHQQQSEHERSQQTTRRQEAVLIHDSAAPDFREKNTDTISTNRESVVSVICAMGYAWGNGEREDSSDPRVRQDNFRRCRLPGAKIRKTRQIRSNSGQICRFGSDQQNPQSDSMS